MADSNTLPSGENVEELAEWLQANSYPDNVILHEKTLAAASLLLRQQREIEELKGALERIADVEDIDLEYMDIVRLARKALAFLQESRRS